MRYVAAFLFAFAVTHLLAAASLTGIVTDPSGAVVQAARIDFHGSAGAKTTVSDSAGRYSIALPPGTWKIRVDQAGFQAFTATVTITDADTKYDIRLEVAEAAEQMEVTGKISALANADANYRALRDGAPQQSFSVENVRLQRDVGEFTLHSGTVTFLSPVLGRQPVFVFHGTGEFKLQPPIAIERNYVKSIVKTEAIEDNFEKAVFCATDSTAEEIRRIGKPVTLDTKARDILLDYQGRVRHRNDQPRSFIEAIFNDDDMLNVDAELLADLYNPSRPGGFRAFLFGRTFADLRFIVSPLGAVPQLPAPEEVAVVHLDPQGDTEGILYLAHFLDEMKAGTARSLEDKRVVAAEHYRIETVIGGNEHLTATATIRVRGVRAGERVVRFGLLPNLRVSRVALGQREIHYIQQGRKQDGALYVILPEPLAVNQTAEITVEYQGDKVVQDAGGGNFAVGARTSWYPSLNAFLDQATYDLTFKVPKRYALVSVGRLDRSWKEDKFAASHWVSDVPLAVAGFNYGEFRKKEVSDEPTKYLIEGYAAKQVPDYLRGTSADSASPSALMDGTMVDAQNSLRIYSDWFGAAPYGRIAITQQPQFGFGQSWPGLVYLPMSAFLDTTQRWQLMGISNRMTEFVQEVTPHEVAHQWWGHMVGWASFHDQWLSEGFADFSAGLFLQLTEKKPDKYLKYLDRSREMILEKNNYGHRANDAGPVWMGLRLMTAKNSAGYSKLVYPKGGYVLHMLRQMMWDAKTGDAAFKAMMQDFVKTHLHKPASTESFQATVERHMTPKMNLTGNGRLDWFFSEWLFGTEVPKYTFDYDVKAGEGGFVVTGKLTQSEVSSDFAMPVPIYAELETGVFRLGTVFMKGSTTKDNIRIVLPVKPKRVLVNAWYDVLAYK